MDNLRGISLMVLSMAFFAIDDVFIKFLSVTMSVPQILAVIGAAGTILFAVWAKIAGHRFWSPDFFDRTVLLRNLSEVLGTIFFVSALAVLVLSRAPAATVAFNMSRRFMGWISWISGDSLA